MVKTISVEKRQEIEEKMNDAREKAFNDLFKAEEIVNNVSRELRDVFDSLPKEFGITNKDTHLMRLINSNPNNLIFRISANGFINDQRDKINQLIVSIKELANLLEE